MTTTDPRRLDTALDDTLRAWPTITGQSVPSALFCAAEHHISGHLCSRLDGHAGLHVAGDGDDWSDDPKETDR